MQLRQIDIEQNQIRLQCFGLLDGLQPIYRLDGLELRASLKRRTDETAERRMILDNENPQRHLDVSHCTGSVADFTPDTNSAATRKFRGSITHQCYWGLVGSRLRHSLRDHSRASKQHEAKEHDLSLVRQKTLMRRRASTPPPFRIVK